MLNINISRHPHPNLPDDIDVYSLIHTNTIMEFGFVTHTFFINILEDFENASPRLNPQYLLDRNQFRHAL